LILFFHVAFFLYRSAQDINFFFSRQEFVRWRWELLGISLQLIEQVWSGRLSWIGAGSNGETALGVDASWWAPDLHRPWCLGPCVGVGQHAHE
jgi:hypothetical protein